ncbi:YciI family protein [Lacisediminihabitans sp. FW035]
MPYVIETWDKPQHQQLRAFSRAEHLDYLDRHSARLLACGAKLRDDGSDLGGGLYVFDTEVRADAERFIADDPFSLVGLFERVTVTRWRKAYVDGKCYLPSMENTPKSDSGQDGPTLLGAD